MVIMTLQTQSLCNGITCAAYNGSVVESAARLLVDTIGQLHLLQYLNNLVTP